MTSYLLTYCSSNLIMMINSCDDQSAAFAQREKARVKELNREQRAASKRAYDNSIQSLVE